MTETWMLTTVDNPYDPFTQYDAWYVYDIAHNYNTCSYLARIALTSDQMSDEENEESIREAMQEIVDNDFLGLYKIVKRNDTKTK